MEKDYNKEPLTRTWFYFAGIGILIIAGLTAISLICYYNYTGYIRDAKVADVAQSIASISGLLATLAGLFFVLDNLILQRKSLAKQYEAIEHSRTELDLTRDEIAGQTKEFIESNKHYKLQSDTMILQKNENTFFNLVDLHKKTSSILKAEGFFSEFLGSNLKKTQEYMQYFNQQYFPGFQSTRLNPRYYCSPYNLEKDQRLELFVDNLKEIVYFIHNKLDNDVFYHKVLYNTLLPQEKFILGMVQTLELFGFSLDIDLSNLAYIYSKHYNSIQSYKYYYGYFPMMKLQNSHRSKLFHKSAVSVMPFEFTIVLLENYHDKHQIILRKVNVLFKEKNTNKEPARFNFSVEKDLVNEVTFNYADIIKRIVELNTNTIYELNFNFVFMYNSREITVAHYDELTITLDDRLKFLNNQEEY